MKIEINKMIFVWALVFVSAAGIVATNIASAYDVNYSYPEDLTFNDTLAMKAQVIEKIGNQIQALDNSYFIGDAASAKAILASDFTQAKDFASKGQDYWLFNKLVEIRTKITGVPGHDVVAPIPALINATGQDIVLPYVDGASDLVKIDTAPIIPAPNTPLQGFIGETFAWVFIGLVITAIVLGIVLFKIRSNGRKPPQQKDGDEETGITIGKPYVGKGMVNIDVTVSSKKIGSSNKPSGSLEISIGGDIQNPIQLVDGTATIPIPPGKNEITLEIKYIPDGKFKRSIASEEVKVPAFRW